MSLTQADIRSFEQVRQRRVTTQQSLDLLRSKLINPQNREELDPLPPWPSLQESANSFVRNMDDLQKIMESSQELFKTAHAYPHATFPGTTFEGNLILARLLRKRVEPDVEAWIKEHTEDTKVQQWDQHRETGLQQDEQQSLLTYAGEENARVLEELVTKGAMDFDYTLAEYEEGVGKVRTGLKRKLPKKLRNPAADEDEDDEDDEDEED
ncbi:mediator of RNA polymerase II transcription subunit 8, partial [Oleoguttula sp. CCFEE 5521]